MAPCGIILREITLKTGKMSNQETQEAYTISPELMPGRVAEILNGAWREFREGSTDGAVTDRDSLCRTFSELIRERAAEEKDFFIRTGVIPEGSSQRKKIDIECGFRTAEATYSCAIILKFILDNNAFTSKMFRIYRDLHFLEDILYGADADGYSECRFYMVTGSEAFRTTAAYRTKSEDFPEFGLNRHSTAKYVRYHDARESGERQELIFRNEYDINWWPQAGSSNWHFLEVDVNAKTVDCIVGVYHVEDEDGNLVYEHHVLKEQEYEDFMRGRSDRSLEAAFRLSETPFENADRQPWSLNNGKILYASDIKIARSASEVIFDVLHDFLVINTVEMGGKTLRVRLEDRKMIKSLSDAEDYWEVGSERRGLVGRSQIAYYEVDAEDFE